MSYEKKNTWGVVQLQKIHQRASKTQNDRGGCFDRGGFCRTCDTTYAGVMVGDHRFGTFGIADRFARLGTQTKRNIYQSQKII